MSVYTEVKEDLKHHMMRANKQRVFCMERYGKHRPAVLTRILAELSASGLVWSS